MGLCDFFPFETMKREQIAIIASTVQKKSHPIFPRCHHPNVVCMIRLLACSFMLFPIDLSTYRNRF